MNLTREQIAAELTAAGWSDTKAADLADIHIAIEEAKASGVPFVRVERGAK